MTNEKLENWAAFRVNSAKKSYSPRHGPRGLDAIDETVDEPGATATDPFHRKHLGGPTAARLVQRAAGGDRGTTWRGVG